MWVKKTLWSLKLFLYEVSLVFWFQLDQSWPAEMLVEEMR